MIYHERNATFQIHMPVFIIQSSSFGTRWEIALTWKPQNLTNEKSTYVHVMVWCHQLTSHYVSHCWPRSMAFPMVRSVYKSSYIQHCIDTSHNMQSVSFSPRVYITNPENWYSVMVNKGQSSFWVMWELLELEKVMGFILWWCFSAKMNFNFK